MTDFDDTPPAPIRDDPPSARRRTLRAALSAWLARLQQDDWTAYLERATHLGDLERRVRRWDQRDANTRP